MFFIPISDPLYYRGSKNISVTFQILLGKRLKKFHEQKNKLFIFFSQSTKMKWWILALSLFCLSMAVFPEVAEASGRDSDGDGTPDIGKNFHN